MRLLIKPLKLYLKRSWCIGRVDGTCIAWMDELRWLYAQPYDEQQPVVRFDERPCFLIGEQVEALSMQSEQVRRMHYAYEKNGSCALLAAAEPLSGRRFGRVYPQWIKHEHILCCQALASRYLHAQTIHLVQDNLNTHSVSSFYEHMPADQVWALAQRFTFY